jgi:hypothetical protein
MNSVWDNPVDIEYIKLLRIFLQLTLCRKIPSFIRYRE